MGRDSAKKKDALLNDYQLSNLDNGISGSSVTGELIMYIIIVTTATFRDRHKLYKNRWTNAKINKLYIRKVDKMLT